MKKNVFKIGLFSMILIGLVSCKNKEKELADKRIVELENYVDSLKTVIVFENDAKWDMIASDFDQKKLYATDAIVNLDNETKMASQSKIDASATKYNEYVSGIAAQKAAAAKSNPSQILRDRLFGAGKIGADMSFSYVNKNNIRTVYENFFRSYKDNKSDFSREDYDEIKLMYEALDSRKNTVEKEGLSTSDNTKIATIKLKFAPMFKMNRMGAKSRENADAKE